jgi:hypothetical protein
MRFTRAMLDGHAEFDGDEPAFTLTAVPSILAAAGEAGPERIPLGRYELPRRSEEAHVYRLQHPLAQGLLRIALRAPLGPARLCLDYDAYGPKVSVLEALCGREGVAAVRLLRVQSLGATEEYLLAAGIAAGELLDAEVTEKLLALPGRAESPARPGEPPVPAEIAAELARQQAAVVGSIERRNLVLFTGETEKLDAWADDLKVGLEREIKELDRRIKETRTRSKGAATLAEKLEAHKEQRELEGQRDKKRRELFVRQDEIQARRDRLIEELEAQLRQQVVSTDVFACEWALA